MSKYDITPIKSTKIKALQSKESEAGILPETPFRCMINGACASGKTVLTANLVKKFYNKHFDAIYLLCASPESLLSEVIKNKKRCFGNPSKFIEIIDIIHKEQKKIFKSKKNDLSKTPSVLIIMDDILGEKEFLKSDEFKGLMTFGRHSNISTMILVQSFKGGIPKACRLQMSQMIFFKGCMSEVDIICEDFCCPNMTKNDMRRLVHEATKDPYAFLNIMMGHPFETRYRKNLMNVIPI